MESIRIKDGQDLDIQVENILVDENAFDFESTDWEVRLFTYINDVHLVFKDGTIESIGKISANAEIVDNVLRIYAKSSKSPFGVGSIQCEMTIYAPNEKFEDEIQVLKTLRSSTNIIIV